MPLYIGLHIIGRSFVKGSKDPAEVFTVKSPVDEIVKSKAAIEEEQGEGKDGFAPVTKSQVCIDGFGYGIHTEKHLSQSGIHRNQVGHPQRSAK